MKNIVKIGSTILLIQIASAQTEFSRENIRDSDLACRYGGDEFALILPRSSLEEADVFAKRLIKKFRVDKMQGVSFSMGIAGVGPDDFVAYEALLRVADKEMYKAKEKTKKRRGFYISSTFIAP